MATYKYKPRTIQGARNRVLALMKEADDAYALVRELRQENFKLIEQCKILAMLCADGPSFDNPLHIAAAKTLRDEILRRECKLNPDGTRIK